MSSPACILLSEGSSLSARESITALGMAGYRVEVCDPDPLCLGRFSRFVRHFYRCPPVGKAPWAYLDFVCALLRREHHDVLFPSHEQAFLFSGMREQIPPGAALAVAEFDSFLRIQGKAALARTLRELSIPQPESVIIQAETELARARRFPCFLKADYGTASTGTWRVDSADRLVKLIPKLRSKGLLGAGCELVLQAAVRGSLARVQAVFANGKLVLLHGYRQIMEGLGGGDMAKLSGAHPDVLQYLECLGERLHWHGALSLDYILPEDTNAPLFIDANARLVEPMNGVFSGVNLAEALVRVSLGEKIPAVEPSRAGVRSHMLLMGLLAAADRRRSRLDTLRELWRGLARRGLYAHSREELLPVHFDPWAVVPLGYALTRLILNPKSAKTLSLGAITPYSLTPEAVRQISAAH